MTAVGAHVLQRRLDALPRPTLVLSTLVGRGMHSIGEALQQRAPDVQHRAVEEFLPRAGLREDVERYRAISSRAPWLLHIPYRVPWIYQRKLLRERHLRSTDLSALEDHLRAAGYRSVLAVSHRPAFWAGLARERAELSFELVGLSGEYGSSLGWRFVPWSSLAGFLSPVPRADLRFPLPPLVRFEEIALPARLEYERLAATPGDPDAVLVVCGYWGQGRIDRILGELLAARPGIEAHAVCGENEALRRRVERRFGAAVRTYGVAPSLAPLLRRCASVVSKPGIATVVEAHAAGRKQFLLRGMPVAEDHNLRFAVDHFGASRYSRRAFQEWRAGLESAEEGAACLDSAR